MPPPPAIKLAIAPPGYTVIHAHRPLACKKRRGCVAIIHRGVLKFINSPIPISTQLCYESLEVCVQAGRAKFHLVVIYRPTPSPTRQFFEQIADLCDRLSGDESIICGYLNCPGTDSTLVDDRLLDVIKDQSLFQFVQRSTRRFGANDLGGNILNVVIGRQNSLIQDDIKITEVGYSDHNLFSVVTLTETSKILIIINLKKYFFKYYQ